MRRISSIFETIAAQSLVARIAVRGGAASHDVDFRHLKPRCSALQRRRLLTGWLVRGNYLANPERPRPNVSRPVAKVVAAMC